MAAVSISQGHARHRLEFMIGSHPLPYNMTVYQAVRQFSGSVDRDSSETDTDTEHPYGHTGIWVHTHTIWCVHSQFSIQLTLSYLLSAAGIDQPRKQIPTQTPLPAQRKLSQRNLTSIRLKGVKTHCGRRALRHLPRPLWTLSCSLNCPLL